ncbi:hypothetical protein Zmor_021368 [Zophobas morio]|uniref:Uncharacterized protein n=1 Tax=Zophobas morio TaxID=2755281 RepID=A0AA38I560_9CUCU|nr:hypothetical protein Zmor_021368 [Zophobas morio]
MDNTNNTNNTIRTSLEPQCSESPKQQTAICSRRIISENAKNVFILRPLFLAAKLIRRLCVNRSTIRREGPLFASTNGRLAKNGRKSQRPRVTPSHGRLKPQICDQNSKSVETHYEIYFVYSFSVN